MKTKRVVITGMGTINPLGNDVESFLDNLFTGKNSIKEKEEFNSSKFFTSLVSEVVNFKLKDHIPDRKIRKLLNRGEGFVISAATQAIENSHILESKDFPDTQFGLFLGCTKEFAPFESVFEALQQSINEDDDIDSVKFGDVAPEQIQPLIILESIPNACIEYISELFSLKGENTQFMTNGVASTQAIGSGYLSIKFGRSVAALCGGFDSLTDKLNFASFDSLGLLTSNRNNFKGPFDCYRDGFVMGEGAGMLVLEDFEHAKKRGATIYAEITGYSSNMETTNILSLEESGESLVYCLEDTLKRASLSKSDVSFVSAYASGTKIGDKSELNAIAKVFDGHKISISAIKGALGHLVGASGAVESIAALGSLQKGNIPPNVNISNLDNPYPNISINLKAENVNSRKSVIKISRGMGGQNAVLVFRKE
jgi:3-oxoacyl-[acyl-carrier-protein] synthase II